MWTKERREKLWKAAKAIIFTPWFFFTVLLMQSVV